MAAPTPCDTDMSRTLVCNHSHWGAFNAVVEDGRVVGATPFALGVRAFLK